MKFLRVRIRAARQRIRREDDHQDETASWKDRARIGELDRQAERIAEFAINELRRLKLGDADVATYVLRRAAEFSHLFAGRHTAQDKMGQVERRIQKAEARA